MTSNYCLPIFVLIVSGVSHVFCDCENLPVVEKSTNNATTAGPFPTGTVIHYTCETGHEADGSQFFTCENVAFTGQLTCTPLECPAIDTPRNGKVSNNPSYEVGSIISFDCNPGYDAVGQTQLRCRIDGNWDPSYPPQCEAKDCGEFGVIQHAQTFQATNNGVSNKYGNRVRVTCETGFILTGKVYVECLETGVWDKKPVCEDIQCPPFPGLETNCLKDTVFFSGQLYITCRDDVSVTKVGGSNSECSDAGQWTKTDVACYCDCLIDSDTTHMTLININDQGYLPHAATLSWSCKDKYTKSTQESLTCTDGQMTMPVCKKPYVIVTTTESPDGGAEGSSGGDATPMIVGGIIIGIALIAGLGVALLLKMGILCSTKDTPNNQQPDCPEVTPLNNGSGDHVQTENETNTNEKQDIETTES